MPLYLHDHKRPTLFLHIPKTGGTTIETWLEEVYGSVPLFLSKEPSSNLESTPQHFGYQTLTTLLGDFNELPLLKFAIVRNPYHRLESEFFYRVQMRAINLGKQPEKMFSAWVCDVVNKAKSCPGLLDNHLRTQIYYYNDDVQIYKFEDSFEHITSDIAAKLNVEAPDSVNSKKVGKKKAVVWSNDAITLVNEFYKDDFTKFEYSTRSQQPTSIIQSAMFTCFTLSYSVLTWARILKHRTRNKQ